MKTVVNMTVNKKISGWKEKAQNQLRIAEDCLKRFEYSESIQASQECIEFSVKALLSILRIKFPLSHEWKIENKSFDPIVTQIKERGIIERLEKGYYSSIRLPRLLFIFNFWAQCYTIAKYGIEKGDLASARDIFVSDIEAKLALQHAHECNVALGILSSISEEHLSAIIGNFNEQENDR